MRSLVWATDVDVLAVDRVVERREGYWVARSPGQPDFWWGNLLLFDDAPGDGDGPRWEHAFERELPEARHRTFGWDTVDGRVGAVHDEFVARGYELEENVGFVADALRPHPRANREVEVRALDPQADEPLWDAVLELQVAGRDDSFGEDEWRAFATKRLADLRAHFAEGRGTWYVALAGEDVAAACGVVVTDARARFQVVETAAAQRRRGIASRLLADAAAHAEAAFGAERFVIVADAHSHAVTLYESLGFRAVERTVGVCRRPPR